MKIPAIPKYLLRVLFWGIPILAVPFFWGMQQNNVNSLDKQIDALQQRINALPPTVAPEDKLGLEKDRLTLEKDLVNAQNAIYGTLSQALGTVFFVVTAYFTYRNVKATEEKQVTERFSKAIELLGSEKLAARLGGIYALERIAKDSPTDHWTIMEVLCSFVKEKSFPPSPKNAQQRPPDITLDAQAALIVIGRRDFRKDPNGQKLELSYANLIGAKLVKANFNKANLALVKLSAADLSYAILTEVNFFGANFFDDLFVVGVKLVGADLSYANLQKVNLRGVDLSKAIGLTSEQISKATTDEKTKLPDYLQSPESSQSEPPDPQKPLV